jgi:putative restriction endonuclease
VRRSTTSARPWPAPPRPASVPRCRPSTWNATCGTCATRPARKSPPDAPERRAWLLDQGASGRLRPPIEQLRADPATLAAVARLLLDMHFTPVLADLMCAAVDLDVPALDLAGTDRVSRTVRLRPRRCGFAEEVLRAYAYQCAMCGFDGALGRYPVAIEAAQVRWHSQQGPDEITNALALCALHHVLFDVGVLGITEHRRIRVSTLYVARNEAGQAVDSLAGKRLLTPRPLQPTVDIIHISWHHPRSSRELSKYRSRSAHG